MAAFKQHCAFGFGHGRQVVVTGKDGDAMGQFGRIRSLEDLPPERELVALVRKAAALIDAGVKPPRAPKSGDNKPPPETPPDLAAALKRRSAARQTFAALAPSQQRDYIEWLGQAKREDTRARRLAQALQWLVEGKPHNWKYERR